MASEGLTCSICCHSFDDKTHCPRSLSCGHSFCSLCLRELLERNPNNCPKCRKTFTVPMSAGVVDLPKNFSLLEIMDTENATPQQAENIVSPICEETEVLVTKVISHAEKIKAAERGVLDAMTRMKNVCEDLSTLLQTFFKSELHARLNYRKQCLRNELDQFFQNVVDMSPGSAGLPGNFAFLSIKNANDHECILQAEAVSICRREEMVALATNGSTDTEKIKTAEEQVTSVIRDLKKACNKVACATDNLFIELRAELTAREKALITELKDLHILKHFILFEQYQRLYEIRACLESAIQYFMSDIQSLSHADLPALSSNIKSVLEDIESQCIVLEPEAEYVPEVTFDDLTLWNLQNLEGCALVHAIKGMGAVSDKSTCAANTTAAGLGLKYALLGYEASFTITACDAQGYQRTGLGGDVFMVELRSKDEKGEGKVGVNLEYKGNGTYLGTYTVPVDAEPGDYTLSVRLRGDHILNSPFVVRVKH